MRIGEGKPEMIEIPRIVAKKAEYATTTARRARFCCDREEIHFPENVFRCLCAH